ncbi:sulfatase [Phytoactinopolyspora endophytica]|uniref:sulfatase family protein n=1 Tax=Phytoactinopolyspora endophytica TaxID=1642495 RepID=UPI00101BB0F1|nr:sulfatase [Phytoactinopolyspora endophytica]
MATQPPANVLLIHCHDLGRFLGCYGVETVHTPVLDALAADGITFTDAFCTAPQCSPSRAALFTGRYPHSTGVMGLTHKGWDLHDSERHLAQLLRDGGYRTDLIGIHHESLRCPDDQIAAQLGFDHVDTLGATHYERRAELVADRSVAVLADRARHPDQPFYLQAGFLEPHRLQNPEPGRDAMGFTGGYIEPDRSRGVTIPGYLANDDGTQQEIAELQGAVTYTDAAIGRILTELDRTGLAERTIVIFTTDHGLALPAAKCTLRDPGLETALIMRAPSLGWTGGRTVDGLVSNVDIAPTLLEAVGLPTPGNVHGRSIGAALAGESWQPREEVFAELTFHDYYDPQRCVRTDRHKLIVHFDRCNPHTGAATQSWRPRSTPVTERLAATPTMVELYDLDEDPLELTNLATDPHHTDLVDQLRRTLLGWMEMTDDPLLHSAVSSPAQHSAQHFVTTGQPAIHHS